MTLHGRLPQFQPPPPPFTAFGYPPRNHEEDTEYETPDSNASRKAAGRRLSAAMFDETQTTMTTLSPQSRHTDRLCGVRTSLSKRMQNDVSLDDNNSVNYEPLIKTGMLLSNSSGASTSLHMQSLKAPSRRGHRQQGICGVADSVFGFSQKNALSRLKKFTAFLCFIILFLLFAVLYLFVALKSLESRYTTYDRTGSVYYHHHIYDVSNVLGKPELLMLALPQSFRLGELVTGDLPPGQIVYTQFSLQHDDVIQLNISVSANARIAVYARQTLRPSLTAFDFTHTIRGDHLHVNGISKKSRSVKKLARSALVTMQLFSGRWHLGFLNDGDRPESITFIASIVEPTAEAPSPVGTINNCKYDCFNKGVCKNDKCHCFSSFSGEYCEETVCPVLCSGNGIFSNGKCSCHDGFKGPECDVDARWCLVPNCNEHGYCNANGECICNGGWKGEFCDIADCADPTCTGNGICHNATCYCAAGWQGKHCELRFSSTHLSDESYNDRSLITRVREEQNIDYPLNPTSAVLIFQPQFEAPKPVPPKKDLKIPRCNKNEIYDRESNRCKAVSCSHECIHGQCINGRCVCEALWTGATCNEHDCSSKCSENGECKNGQCECNRGWNGKSCLIQGCRNNCSDAGDCQFLKEAWQCVCDSYHYGPHCEFARETECDDGIDNDGDGLTDCEDSECCSVRSCSTNPLCTSGVPPREVLLRIQPDADSDFFHRHKFLIDHDSVQRYADISLFNNSRAAVVCGKVMSSKGGPLTGVRISDTANNRYGFSLSRNDVPGGQFDIMVIGGSLVTLQFLRQPFGKVEKTFFVPVNNVLNVGDVVLDELAAPKPLPTCTTQHLKHSITPKITSTCSLVQQFGGFYKRSELETTKVSVYSGVLYDVVPVSNAGDMFLVYASDRAQGFKSAIYMMLLSSEVPPSLNLVHVKVHVAGRNFLEVFEAKENLTNIFYWDQLNVYMQDVYGLTQATVAIGYEYQNCNQQENIVWHYERILIEGRKSRTSTFGLWSLNFHHHFDYANNLLERGDGTTEYFSQLPMIVHTLVGTESQREPLCGSQCVSQFVAESKLFQPSAVAVTRDGTIYIGDYNLIRRISSDGQTMDVVLELNLTDIVHAYYLAVDPVTDTLHISIPVRRQLWILRNTKTIRNPAENYKVIVGDGSTCVDTNSACGDGGMAIVASLIFPKDLTFDNTGNIIFLDGRRIRMVTKDKTIVSVIASPDWKPSSRCANSFLLKDLLLDWPMSIAFDPISNSLVVLDSDVLYRIILNQGIVQVLAGSKRSCDVHTTAGLPPLNGAQAITFSPDSGLIYIVESDSKRHNLLRSLSINGGSLRTIAGQTSKCDCDRINCPCDNTGNTSPIIAVHSFFHKPCAVAVDSKGRIFVADQANFKIKVVERQTIVFDNKEQAYKINSPETNEVYYFNKHGMHQKTMSLLGDKELYTFHYTVDTSFGELIQVTSKDGNVIKFSRANNSELIIDGTMTKKLVVELNNFDKQLFHQVRDLSNGGDTIKFNYGLGQMLESKSTDYRLTLFDYDKSGRIVQLSKSDGETWTFLTNIVDRRLQTEVLLNGKKQQRYMANGNMFTKDSPQPEILFKVLNTMKYNKMETKSTFETSNYPLLPVQEHSFIKRKITLPTTDEPNRPELSSHFEWRTNIRSNENRRVIQVNGRNVFTVEFNTETNTDIIRDAFDNPAAAVVYSSSGQVKQISYPENHERALLNITYDEFHLPLQVSWVDRRRDFAYDSFHRLIASTHSRKGDLLTRKYTYGLDTARHPSIVHMSSGEMYKWRYNKKGEVSSLKSPTDEIIEFWSSRGILPTAAVIVYRQEHHGVATSVYDSNGHLTEFITFDGLKRVTINRTAARKLHRIRNGHQNHEFSYDNHGRVKSVSSGAVQRDFVYQGPLVVGMRRQSKDYSIYFSTEYDNFYRPTVIHTNFNGTALESMQFEYDLLSGKISKLARVIFTEHNNKLKISNDVFTLVTAYTHDRFVESMNVIIGGTDVVQMKATYDLIGRLESILWIVKHDTWPTEMRLYSVDGSLSEYSTGDTGKQTWSLFYDSSGRVSKINSDVVKLDIGGAAQTMGAVKYGTDANGWVVKRDSTLFEYDGLGQVIRATSTRDAFDFVYVYDEQQRIVSRTDRISRRTHNFFYAFTDRYDLITHFIDSKYPESVWTIYYTSSNTPFMIESSSGQTFVLVTDPLGSLRFVLSDHGSVERQILYSPTGNAISDSNSELFVPIGYLSQFHDYEAKFVLIRERFGDIATNRPLDVFIGRFMSTTISIAPQYINTFAPDFVADPFKFSGSTLPSPVPLNIEDWMQLSGIDIANLIPFKRLNIDNDEVCSGVLISDPFCSANQQLGLFSQLMTLKPSHFVNKDVMSTFTMVTENIVGIQIKEPSDIGAGFVVSIGKNNEVNVLKLKLDDNNALSTIEKMLNRTELVIDYIYLGNLRFNQTSVSEIHFIKKGSLVTATTELPHKIEQPSLNITQKNSHLIELSLNGVSVFVHYQGSHDLIKEEALQRLQQNVAERVWKAERRALKAALPTKVAWNESQQRELLNIGYVLGYTPRLKTSATIDSIGDIENWNVERLQT